MQAVALAEGPVRDPFISEDPIRFRGGINFYAYVGNNPVNRLDPFGLKTCCSNGGSGSYADCWSRCVQKGLGNAANYMLGLALAGGTFGMGNAPVYGGTITAAEYAGGFVGGMASAAGAEGAGVATGAAVGAGATAVAGVAAAGAAGYAIGTFGYCAYLCARDTCSQYP